MPSFNFSININKNNKSINNKSKHKILQKNVNGVIWIDDNADYYVNCNNTKYNINPKCYSCKDKTIIYQHCPENKTRVCIIRLANACYEQNPLYYLPFSFGLIVSGNIIIKNNIKYFDIKDIWTDYNNKDAINACCFYKENYNKLQDIIKNKRFNGIR